MELPHTLHELLQAAWDDLKTFENDPAFRIDFGSVIDATRTGAKGLCEVDLAGALLIRRFGAKAEGEINLEILPRVQIKIVECLDALENGYVGRAAAFFRAALKAQQNVKYDKVGSAYEIKTPSLDHLEKDKRDEAITNALAILRSAGI